MENETSTNPAERSKGFLEGILERMHIEAQVQIKEEEERIVLDIECDEAEKIIGRRGQLVDALQHLVGKMTYRDRSVERGKPIIVDADGYRAKTIERLESLAKRMAEKALETKRDVDLNPMSAHDRRIVHMTIADMDGLSTRSEGTGDRRHVIVIPDAAAE